MKIEFDANNPDEMQMMQRMFNPLIVIGTQTIPDHTPIGAEVEIMPDQAPPVALGTLRDDNLPLTPAPVETPAPEQPVTAPTGELDGSGTPWDKRIHSSGKTRTNKDLWVRRRGVDQKFYEQVVAELLAAIAPGPVVRMTVEQPATTPGPDPAAVFGAQPTAVVATGQPVAPVAAALDWAQVTARVSPGMMAGTHNQIAEAQFLAHHNIGGLHLLIERPELFEAYLLAVGV